MTSLQITGPYVEDHHNLLDEVGQTTEAIGRKLQSKFAFSEEDYDDLSSALLTIVGVIQTCKKMEYPNNLPFTVEELMVATFGTKWRDQAY